jgi:HEXXH motif-containing protein
VIETHRLPEEAFTALASGDGGPAVIQLLRGVQYSKHLMLLSDVVKEAGLIDRAAPGAAAFRAGFALLTAVQQADPDAVARLLSLPHVGGWLHDCLDRKAHGLPLDFGYLAAAAAAAGIQARIGFELEVPVADGRVVLPGLGYFQGVEQDSWVRLRSDGERLAVGAHTVASCAALAPDDGSGVPGVPGEQAPQWRKTDVVRAVAAGHTWTVLLETGDHRLDRFALPMSGPLTAEEVANWQGRIQSAWEVLVRHHDWAADSIADGVSVVIPLKARSDTDLDSATTPAAFGAIATSWPPDPVIMAETLVHEFQHLKLCCLLAMMPLLEPCDELVYAPWREDPRPAGGLLQGVYAHLGVARFWNAQRHVETEPDNILRAEVMFARWRSTIEPAVSALLRTGCLTPAGVQFVTRLGDEGQHLCAAPVSAHATAIARDVALHHWLTWQLRHSAVDAAEVTSLAAAYQCGEPLSGRELRGTRIEEDTRKISSTVRSRVLSMRYLEPRRYREQDLAEMPDLSAADVLLISGQASAAVQAYRAEILAAPEPLPDSWVGLALAMHMQAETPLPPAFATRLPLIFDVDACLRGQGVQHDPLDLAAWFA